MINFGDIITDAVIAALLSAIATIIGAYFLFKSKVVLPKEQKVSLDSETMKRYDDLMNQQLAREEELRQQLVEVERNGQSKLAEVRIQHAKEMAAQAERIQNLEMAVHGDWLLTVQFATLPDPLVRNATIKLIGKPDAQLPTNPDPGTPPATS